MNCSFCSLDDVNFDDILRMKGVPSYTIPKCPALCLQQWLLEMLLRDIMQIWLLATVCPSHKIWHPGAVGNCSPSSYPSPPFLLPCTWKKHMDVAPLLGSPQFEQCGKRVPAHGWGATTAARLPLLGFMAPLGFSLDAGRRTGKRRPQIHHCQWSFTPRHPLTLWHCPGNGLSMSRPTQLKLTAVGKQGP